MTHKFKIAAFHTALLLSVVIVLNACSPVTAQRGNMLDDTQLPKVVAGESTMRDVLQTFGSPTAQSTFDTKLNSPVSVRPHSQYQGHQCFHQNLNLQGSHH